MALRVLPFRVRASAGLVPACPRSARTGTLAPRPRAFFLSRAFGAAARSAAVPRDPLVPGAGGSVPAKVAEHTPGTADRSGRGARALPALYHPSEASTASHEALRGARDVARDRARLRAQVLAPFRRAPRKALHRSRPPGAHRTPRAFNSDLHVLLKVAAQRSEPRPGGPRGGPAERSAAGHESAGADKRVYRRAGSRRRVPDGRPGGTRGHARCPAAGASTPRAGAPAGAIAVLFGRVVSRGEAAKEEAPARRDACAARRARHAWPCRTQRTREHRRAIHEELAMVRTTVSSAAAGRSLLAADTLEGLSSAFCR